MGVLELVKEAGEAVGFEMPPWAGPVVAIYGVYHEISEMDNDHLKDILESAQDATRCKCIELCKPLRFSPVGVALIDLTNKKRGCTFVFEGVPMWHPHARFDVRALSARAYAYNRHTDKTGIQVPPFESCPICSLNRPNP